MQCKIEPSFCLHHHMFCCTMTIFPTKYILEDLKNVFVFNSLLSKSLFYIKMVMNVYRGTKMKLNNLQAPALQISLLNKSLDFTLSQYALQDRTFVLSPLPHVSLQDDHSPHELYSGGPKRPFSVDLSANDKDV